jgi:hypothetical protein
MNPEPVDTDAVEAPRPPADPATYEPAYQEAKRAPEDQESAATFTVQA